MNQRDRILQEKTRYVNKKKEVYSKIESLKEELKEYQKVIDIKDRELEELNQPKLF